MQLIGPPPAPAHPNTDYPPLPEVLSRGEGTRLWLVRHAEVEERWHEIAYGSMDVSLSAAGLEATARMAEAFAAVTVDCVLSSDLDRALRMGRGIAGASAAPITPSAALREMDRGTWQGIPKDEFSARWVADAECYWKDPFRWTVPEGEGDEKLFQRAWPVVEEALVQHVGRTVVVAAHGQLIRVLTGRALGATTPESYAYYLDPAHATLLVDGTAGWAIEKQNISARELVR